MMRIVALLLVFVSFGTLAPATAQSAADSDLNTAVPLGEQINSSLRPQARKMSVTRPMARAMSQMRAGNWSDALRTAGQDGQAARDVIEWHRLRRGRGTAAEIANFLRRNPDWPGLAYLVKKSETALRDAPAADRVSIFSTYPPQTGTGALAYADALTATGKESAAQAAIVSAWQTLALSDAEQSRFLRDYEALLKPHHITRMDRMLWEGWKVNALRMEPYVPAGWKALARARIALRDRVGNPDSRIKKVPEALREHPGLAYERFEWRMRKGLRTSATELLLARSTSAKALGEPQFWAPRRRDMARRAMRDGQTTTAYRIAATHFTETGRHFADLEWLSGYLALRFQKKPDVALRHFRRFRGDVYTPISVGRAGYWLGRAHEAAGDAEAAKTAYALGATYQTSFYGLLAAERAGLPFNDALKGFRPDADWQDATFTRSSVHQAAVALLAAGEGWLSERFWTHLAESQDETSLHLMGKMLTDLGQPHISVMLGKRAAQAGLEIATPYYAVHPVAANAHPVPKELVLAIARRESEFDPKVVSPAGARGLMQVMPGTARDVARKIGLPYRKASLTSDWDYNARLGAAYLKGLAEEFNGNAVMMAAGYNAGPFRPIRWMQRFGDPRRGQIDIVDWIEMVPFNETRNYIMRVTESLPVYRARLGKQPHPVPFSKELIGATLLPLSP